MTDAAPLSVATELTHTRSCNYLSPDGHDPHGECTCALNERKLIATLTADKAALESKRRLADQLKVNALERADALEIRATTAEASVAVVVEALKPFAKSGLLMDIRRLADDVVVYTPVIDANYCITAGDLRKATEALKDIPTAAQDLLERRKQDAERIAELEADVEHRRVEVEKRNATIQRLKTNTRTPGTVEVCSKCMKPPRADCPPEVMDILQDHKMVPHDCPIRTASKET